MDIKREKFSRLKMYRHTNPIFLPFFKTWITLHSGPIKCMSQKNMYGVCYL